VFVAVIVFAVVGSAVSGLRGPSSADLARRDAELARIDRAQQLDADLYWLDRLVAGAWRVVPLVAVVGALGFLAVRGVAYARFRRVYAEPSPAGLLPVELIDQATARAALGSFHLARIAEARQQAVPHSLSYAPHIITHRQDAAALLPGDVAGVAQLQAPVPSFAQLLDSGRVGVGNPMLLGFDAADGAPVEGSWLDLYSCGLGGLSGSGKSWTACYLAAQAALFGTRIVLLDPHASNGESLAARLAPLAPRFVCAPAESPREMLAAVELVADELRRRKAGGRGEPMLFIADEYSALQRGALAEPLAELVEQLGQEGRKLNLYAMVAGQVWTASRAGGTEVRDSLASAYVHRCRPAQARMLTGMTAADLPRDLLELPSGTAYLLDTSGDFRRVTIPRMASGDMARVAGLLTSGAPSSAPSSATSEPAALSTRMGFHRASPAGASDGAFDGAAREPLRPHQDAANLTAEEAAIVAGFLAGRSPSDLAAALAGGKKSGDAFMLACRRVADVLRRALRGV